MKTTKDEENGHTLLVTKLMKEILAQQLTFDAHT